MPAAPAWSGGEVRVDVEKARTRYVSGDVELAPTSGVAELPAAVDELVAQGYQLPPGEGGSGFERHGVGLLLGRRCRRGQRERQRRAASVPRITARSYDGPAGPSTPLFPSGESTSLRDFMARAQFEPVVFTSLISMRLLETAAPAKPTQPPLVGVASDDLRR
jgi:hypothetical protein